VNDLDHSTRVMDARDWVRGYALAAMVGAMVAAAGPAAAQARPASADSAVRDSAFRAAHDSLAARLARAEAAIALLTKQLEVEAASAVKTRSRTQLDLSARFITNAFFTTGRVNNVDVPQFALADPAVPLPDQGTRALGLSVRQSRVGAALSVDSVLRGRFEGDVELDFFGGSSAGPGDRRLFPEPRLRTVRARLVWARTTLFVGSDTPLISDLNPISVASIGVPGFVAAGNLWNWLPQVRISHDVLVSRGGSVRAGVQAAVLSPFANVQAIGETDAADAGERSGRPYLEARAHVRWGDDIDAPGAPNDVMMGSSGGEIGVGVHRGWVRGAGDSLSTSAAVSIDARLRIGSIVELRAEAYTGQLLRGLGGGAIGQSYGRAAAGRTIGPPVRNTAGWSQLNVQTHITLLGGIGCGRDRAVLADRPTRLANTSCAAHMLWHPIQPILFGFELRRVETSYADRRYRANHVNIAVGFDL
jgi:hypothetical protein